jgi:hypothetical protein
MQQDQEFGTASSLVCDVTYSGLPVGLHVNAQLAIHYFVFGSRMAAMAADQKKPLPAAKGPNLQISYLL